ncbi:hypothetical protein F4775DRAFT_214080 [Biscogniauxia sp. FL1348]|nr:hypothetical protein F4775DRAFT_214080 [Biscogniauxia sp. FL1348]
MTQANMAKDPLAFGHRPGPSTVLTPADLDEIREYQRVVQFRDAVVSGKHPRIKVPSSSVGKSAALQQLSTSTSTSTSHATERVAPSPSSSSVQPQNSGSALNGYQMGNMQSFKANSQQPAVAAAPTGSAPVIPGVSRTFGTGRTEINPILLEKSDDLIKAELQLQRQRLEKALKDQLDQRKSASKAALQSSEQLPDFDISDILAKALTLVQATAPPPTDVPATANASESSDSFDENTFYSSQHETPEPTTSPRAQVQQEDVQMQDSSTFAHHQQAPYAPVPVSVPVPVPVSAPTAPATSAPPQRFTAHPLPTSTTPLYPIDASRNTYPIQSASMPNQYTSNTGGLAPSLQDRHAPSMSNPVAGGLIGHPRHRGEIETQVISSDSGAASRSENTDSDQPADHSRMQNSHQLLPNTDFRQRESPLVRAHNLSPFAPQPAHVSPLAVARQQPMPEAEVNILQGAPAQVTALRQEHRVVTSPESSPQGDKGGKKKNKKKNKRKAEARAQEAPGSPLIKPEPRSPSPVSAPSFTRPHKRQRPTARQEPELIYDEPIIEQPASRIHPEGYSVAPVHVDRVPLGYERDDPYSRQVRHSVAPLGHRLEPSVYEERRPDGTTVQYIRRVESPSGYASPYGAAEPHYMRSTSYSVASPTYREVPSYQRDGRVSVRPYVDRARSRSPVIIQSRSPAMAPPPAPPPSRIVVDEYGREYIEPPRSSTVARRSVMPSTRPGDHEIVYQRPQIRPASRMPTSETFEEDGVIYRRASPAFVPRRVVTQPDYSTDYRSFRERDYPMQPMVLPGQDFIQIRGAAERRLPEEMPREYISRPTSVRPAEPAPYYHRVQSTRPDIPPRQYAASVHPEARREAAPHVVREFSVRPPEPDMPQREFSVRPVERYYDRPPPREEEITYIERPRTIQQEIVYSDDGRRQVYQ